MLVHFIFWVVLLIGLEVIKVFLFFFGESSEEVGVLVFPSLLCSVSHSLFSAVMVLNIQKVSGMESIDFRSMSFQNIESSLSLKDVLVLTLRDGSLELRSAGLKLLGCLVECLIVDMLLDSKVIPSPCSVGGVHE